MTEQTNFLTILNYDNSVFEIIDYIKDHIRKRDCEKLEIDISRLSLLDAGKVAILCSVYHFTKYPSGSICWHVCNNETKKIIQSMVLKNATVNIINCYKKKVVYINSQFSSSGIN